MNDYTESMDFDARLTAYALGELDGEDAAAVEALIAGDEGAQRTVDAVRELAARLERELAVEAAPGLTDAQRASVLAGPGADRPAVIFTMRRALIGGAFLAAAACLVLALWMQQRSDRIEESNMVAADVRSGVTKGGRERGATELAAERPPPAPLRELDDAAGLVIKDEFEPLGIEEAAEALEGDRLTAGRDIATGRRGRAIRSNSGWVTAPDATVRRDLMAEREQGDAAVMAPPPELHAPAWAINDLAFDVDAAPADREGYSPIDERGFASPFDQPLSTFSIDVDTASYSNVRRFINAGQRPPRDAVRIEELLNYFRYDDPAPQGEHPFAVNVEVGPAPWQPAHRLVRIGLKGRVVDPDMRPATNLVFLIDVSGSMNDREKLPLLKQSLRLLVERLTADDRVAMVVYAGAAGPVLESTYCHQREVILEAIDRLEAGGSTNGGAGINLAYEIAAQHFIEGGVNRVILATDGDLNVGVTSDGDLKRLIEQRRAGGVELNVLGFGTGNLQDAKLETLSGAGNGTYAYIDSLDEAKKVLVDELAGTLVTIAKDVKIQVDFNPQQVGAYRLIGYENRALAARDFTDDTKDAGEIGAGHGVTALYEVVPPEVEAAQRAASGGSKYVRRAEPTGSEELLTVSLRYKQPHGGPSTGFEVPVTDAGASLAQASDDFRFAAAIAAFGMLLRESEHRGDASWEMVLELAESAARDDARRREFVELARRLPS